MAGEKTNGSTEKKTWSYATPYDIVERAKIIAEEGEDALRVKDIDNYIDFINDEMTEGYKAYAPVDGHRNDHGAAKRVTVYRPDESGIYKPYASTISHGNFLGDRIELDDQDAILIYTKLKLGILAMGYIKLMNITPSGDSPYYGPPKVELFEKKLAQELLNLPKTI